MHELLVGLPQKGQVVGLDLVEVTPFFDPTGVTAQTAVRLIIDLLGASIRAR
jgi:agmatinase